MIAGGRHQRPEKRQAGVGGGAGPTGTGRGQHSSTAATMAAISSGDGAARGLTASPGFRPRRVR
ncbi:MAG TPA: hypothetical protein VNT56_09600 [Acidimicrobiales bacterium]|nr:hypothetical protein [Acidimicrobiales bacterium]